MIDQILITDMTEDEWTESAENEPLEECAICGCGFSSVFEGIVCPDCVTTEANQARWEQLLTDETEDEEC